jgi:hypothetical protein
LVVIQENPRDDMMALTAVREIPETMKVFREVHPSLIPSADLQSEMKKHGFRHTYSAQKLVADGKKMLALGFWRD